MAQSPSFGKWLGGIAATVIAAVVIWWLTHPGGLLNPTQPTPEPRPELKIIDVEVSGAYVGRTALATLTIYNEGDTTGEECIVWWWSGSELPQDGSSPTSGDFYLPSSPTFAIRPNETREVSLSSAVYTSPGEFWSWVEVVCSNFFEPLYAEIWVVVPEPEG